jgi:release factor glutamine methyltransferase
MTTATWLHTNQSKLKEAGIATARLDALVLLEDETGKDRGWLLAHPEFVLDAILLKKLNTKVIQRTKHVPLAYIRGFTEFYGRRFIVSPAVLEPRPESEMMIDLLLQLPAVRDKKYTVADVGTGSGALGITAKLELPNIDVDLLEIDRDAIKITQKNVVNFSTPIQVVHSDLLTAAPRPYDILLCNLPYVPDGFQINPAAMAEPRIAIFGGTDGLDLYRRLFEQIKDLPIKPLFVFTESSPPQHQQLARIAADSGFRLQKTNDFIQLFMSPDQHSQSALL